VIGGTKEGLTSTLQNSVATPIVDEDVIILAELFRAGMAPGTTPVARFLPWMKSCSSTQKSLTCPRAQKITSGVSVGLFTFSSNRVLVCTCSHAHRAACVGRKHNKVAWLSLVKAFVQLAMTFITILDARILSCSMTMNEVQSHRLTVFTRELNAQGRHAQADRPWLLSRLFQS
jgi:hypothetical protein